MSATWSGSWIWSISSKRRSSRARPRSCSPLTQSVIARASQAYERSSGSPSRSASALASGPRRLRAERSPDAARDQRPRAGRRLRAGELERAIDPAVDELPVRAAGATYRRGAPPRRTARRTAPPPSPGRAPARSPSSSRRGTARRRAGARSPSRSRARGSAARVAVGSSSSAALEQRERLVELVAADRELGGPAEPGDRLRAEPLQLRRSRRPRRGRRPRAGRPRRSGVRAERRARRGRPRPARASRRTRRAGGRGAPSARPRTRRRGSARAGT